jgi:tripartite ATP-independent transporter DctP family solute receptor
MCKIKLNINLFLITIFSLLFFPTFIIPYSYGADKIIMKIATGTADNHPENIGCKKFEELLEKRTGDKVDVQLYSRGQLGSQKDYVEGLRMGTLEITMVTIGFFSSYEPFLNIFELPFLFRDRDHAFKLVEGPLNNIIKDRVEKHGVKILSYWEAGTRHITNNVRPIYTPADLKGLKIRVPPAKINIDTFKAFGANAAPLAFTEVYLALQQKMFDGQENPLSNIYASKFYEVQKYLSLSGHQFLIHMFMYSKKLWNNVPKDIQKLVEEVAQESAVFQRQVVADDDSKLLAVLKEKGMKVNEVDREAFRKAAEPLYQQYIKEYGEEAEKIINMIRGAK